MGATHAVSERRKDMTVQSVGSFTAGFTAVTNQTGKPAATDGFGTVMSSKAVEKTSPKTKQPESTKTNDNRIQKSDKSLEAKGNTEAENKVNTGQQTDQQGNVEEVETVDVKDLEKVLETIAALLNQVTGVLTQNLEVSEEELLNGALELDLSPADLLDTDSLRELFLNLKNVEEGDLITDENLLESFNDIMTDITELIEESGINEEEFFGSLENLVSDAETPILKTPEFEEVLNSYLAAEASEAPEMTETPEFTVQIEDLRTETPKEAAPEAIELTTETETKAVETAPETENEQHFEGREDGNEKGFVQANDFVKTLAREVEANTEPVQQNTFRDLYDISGQTIDQIRVRLSDEASHMEIQLTPEHLGKVEVNISSKNGAVTAELTAHSEAAKRALEAGLEDLKTALNDTGLKVENVEVTLADYGFRQRDDQNGEQRGEGGRRGRRRLNLDEATDAVDQNFESASEIMKEMNGGNVDYVV